MRKLTVERLGGLAGFGSVGSAIRAEAEIDLDSLDRSTCEQIEDLIKVPRPPARRRPDGFTYRVTLFDQGKASTAEISESEFPASVAARVADRFE